LNRSSIGPASIGGNPDDLIGITSIMIKVLQGDVVIASGDILATGGTLSFFVPPNTNFLITGEAFADTALMFTGQKNIPPLRAGSSTSVSFSLNPVDVIPLKPVIGTVSALGLPASLQGASIQVVQVDDTGATLDTIATGVVSDGTYNLNIPETVNPASDIIFRVTDTSDGGVTMDARYTQPSVIVSPISHAASNLVTDIASDLNTITPDEIQQMERTLTQIALDTGTQNATIDQYAATLISKLKSNLETAHIASSSVTSGEICGLVQDSNNQVLAGITIVVRDFDTHTLRAQTETKDIPDDNGFNYCVSVPTTDEKDVITQQIADGFYIVGAINRTNTSFAASDWWTSSGGAPLRIEAGKLSFIETNTITANFTLEPGVRIEGTVNIASDGPGDPLPGINVMARSKVNQFLAAGAVTDATGFYRINVAPGEYIIESRNNTSQPYASETYNDASGSNIRNFGSVINLAAEQTFTANFELDSGTKLSGEVKENDVAVTGIRVMIDQASGGASTRMRVTNVDGSYQVWLRPDLYKAYAYGQEESVDMQLGPQSVTFTQPVAKLPVEVRHKGNAVSKVKARLMYEPDGDPQLRSTDFSKSDGSLTLYSVTSGSHLVVARVEGQEAFGSIIYDNQTVLGSGTPVSLNPPDEITPPLTLNLRDGGLLTGTVLDTSENPVANFKVTVYQQSFSGAYDQFVSTRTRSDGSYALSLPQGIYAAVTAADENCLNVPIVAGETTETSGTFIHGDGGACVITQYPPSTITISGSILTIAAESILDGTGISLVELDNTGGFVRTVATTTIQAGAYQLVVPPDLVPDSRYEFVVAGGSLSGIYTQTSNMDISPITTAANSLIKSFPNYNAGAITAEETFEIERSLRHVEQENDLSGIAAEGSLDQYVTQLNDYFSQDLDTSNILSSSFASGTICGDVQEGGVFLAGITMLVRDFDTRIIRSRATTDSNGHYCLNLPRRDETDPLTDTLSNGEYILAALNFTNSSTAASQWWTNSGGSNLRIDAGKISVADATPQTFDFTLAPGARFDGIVQSQPLSGAPGEPMPGVQLILHDKTTLFPAAAPRVRPDGTYTVNVLPGEYIVEARNTTFRPYASTNQLNLLPIYNVLPGTVNTVDFNLSDGAEVTGTITENGSSVTGVRVSVGDTTLITTKRDGTYRVWMSPSAYNIFAYGQSDTTPLLAVGDAHTSLFDSPDVAKLPVIVRHDGTGVSRAKVSLVDIVNRYLPYGETYSKSDGSLTLYSTITTDQTIVAKVEGSEPFGSVVYSEPNSVATNLGSGKILTLSAGVNDSVTIDLPDAGVVSGKLIDVDLISLPDIFVEVYTTVISGAADLFVSTYSRSDGSYALSLPEKVYAGLVFDTWAYCEIVPVITGVTTTLNSNSASYGTTCDLKIPSLTIDGITFDRSNSLDLTQHPLNIPTDQQWTLLDYVADTGDTRTYSTTKEMVSGVPVTTYNVVDQNSNFVESESLAIAIDKAVYTLKSFDSFLGIDGTWPTPIMVIPGDLTAPVTWDFTIGGINATGIMTPNVDSPAGYLNTFRIEYIYPDIPYQWTIHLLPGQGILDEYDYPPPDTTEGYSR
jgi:hypothetical protein